MSELDKLLRWMPFKKLYQDGDVEVECRLIFIPTRGNKHYSWSCGYYCFEYDYWLVCGYGNTPEEALLHLKKQLK